MYHAYEATKRHDKVYALLGMSSDNISKSNLLPDYGVPWEELLQRLTKFLLCERISVKTWANKEIVVIKSKGCVLGKISSVRSNIGLGSQDVEAIFENTSKQPGCIRDGSARWTLQTPAKSIETGDFVCLLQGALKPTIIRLREDHFAPIMIAVVPPKYIRTRDGDIEWPELLRSASFTRDFLLVWNWETSSEKLQGKYDTLVPTDNWQSEHSETWLERQLEDVTRTWNVALILGDLGDFENAERMLRRAIESYEIAFGVKHSHTLESYYGLTPLSWAAGNGYNAIVNLLLTKDDVDIGLKDSQYGRTPLLWAAANGHEVVVRRLLEDKADVDSKDNDGRTPLSWATGNGHEAVVKQLLATLKADVDSKDKYGRTPLSWATRNGYKAVVQLLQAFYSL